MYFASINIVLLWEMQISQIFIHCSFSLDFLLDFIWSYWSKKVRSERWNDLAKVTWECGRTGTQAKVFRPLHIALVKCSGLQTPLFWTSVWLDAHRMVLDMEHESRVTMPVGLEIARYKTWEWAMSVKLAESVVTVTASMGGRVPQGGSHLAQVMLWWLQSWLGSVLSPPFPAVSQFRQLLCLFIGLAVFLVRVNISSLCFQNIKQK